MDLFNIIINLFIWFAVFPFLAGLIPSSFMNRVGRTVTEVYLCGLFTMFAVVEICAVPSILLGKTLSFLVALIMSVMSALSVIGLIILAVGFAAETLPVFFRFRIYKNVGMADGMLWVIFFILLAIQLGMSIMVMTTDPNDAFYVGHALASVEHDTMYVTDPYTGAATAVDFRHALSPFPIFTAVISRVTGVHAATVAHTILPLFLMVTAYMIYREVAERVFDDDPVKTPVFLILMVLINSFGNYSVYTRETFLITRTWQGNAVLAGLIIPYVFLIMFALADLTEPARAVADEDDDPEVKKASPIPGLFVMLFMTNLTGALVSCPGMYLLAVLEGVAITCIAVRNKRPLIFPAWILTAAPCFFYLTIYALQGRGL